MSSGDPSIERARAADVAAGRSAADAVLVGASVVDVYARSVRVADVALAGPRIAAVGGVEHCVDSTTQRHDCGGLHLLPGLIEPHFHVGFSQVSVERLAELVVPLGTVVISGCFSESAAIAGAAVVDEQLRRLEGTGLDVLLSPFVASVLGPALGRFSEEQLLELVRDQRCVELREWGDGQHQQIPGALREAWVEAVRSGRTVAGHLAAQHGPALQASIALGVRSDHEATTVEEALERSRMGVTVQMREGSAFHDMLDLIPAITERGADPDLFSFCSDEQELHDIVERGHLDGKLRLAVAHGIDPIEAVRMATLNAARSMAVDTDYGAVTPGRLASLCLVEDLAEFNVARVFSRGRLVAERGRYLAPVSSMLYPAEWNDTVHVARALDAEDLRLDLPDGASSVRVMGVTPGSTITRELIEDVEVQHGRLVRDEPGLAKIALADRHGASGRIGLGLVRGLEIRAGAFASTINASTFNLLVVGVDDDAMALAANRAVELGGGIVVARDGAVRAELPLPLFGIVSHAPLADSVAATGRVADAIRDDLGSPVSSLVAVAGFTCLPGYPELRLTVDGLVRTGRTGEREPVALVRGVAVPRA